MLDLSSGCIRIKSSALTVLNNTNISPIPSPFAKSGDIDHLNPVESDHLLSGAN
jgi:hypothetical protein